MFDELRVLILDNWNQWGLDRKPDDLSFIRRTSTWLGDKGKVIYYIFRRGDSWPCLIAKTVQSLQYGETIRQEAQNLFCVWERVSGIIRQTLPRPIAITEINRLPIYIEEAIPGIALPEKVMRCWNKRKRYHLLAESVSTTTEWLSNFITELGVEHRKLSADDVEHWFLNPLRQLAQEETLGPWERRLLAQLEERVNSLVGRELPFVASHGDFWGGSLLWGTDKKMRVVDWEFFQPKSLPLFDLFMLAVHPGVALNSDGCNLVSEFSMCFEENPHSKQVRHSLKKFSEQLGAQKDILELLFQFFLIRMSAQRDQAQIKVGAKTRTTWAACFEYYLLHKEQFNILP